ncbi:MAG: ABC transporter permease [Asgard group archaeon]|nr:ABC transporter permease [Asgard group archaeon]
MTRAFENAGKQPFIYTYIIDSLNEFYQEFLLFQLFGLLFITPIIAMSISLTSYSANLMKRQQKRQISNMLQRGMSRKEMLGFLILQMLEMTITAILIAFVVGFFFTLLTTQSVGFLNFSGSTLTPAINMIVITTVIVGGLIISAIINAVNIWRLSDISTEGAYSEHKDEKPFWQIYFIDVFLVVVGIVLWIVVAFQMKQSISYIFVYTLGTIAPICLIFGVILFIVRIFPIIIKTISKITWKIKKLGIISLSSKRSSRRSSDVTRSLVLITLTFTIIFSSMVTIESYRGYDKEEAYYQVGADIRIRGIRVSDDTIKNQVLSIEGVDTGTYIRTTSQITTYGDVLYSYLVVGINATEFSEIAYMEKEYLNGAEPDEFFSRITKNDTVVMQEDQIAKIGLKPGKKINIICNKYPEGQINKTLNVIGQYKYFPRYYNEEPNPDATIYRFTIIGNYDTVEMLAYSTIGETGFMIVKVKDGYSIGAVANRIEEKLDRSVQDVDSMITTSEGSLRNTMLFGSLNTSFIASIIVTLSAILLLVLIQAIENEREVVTLKVLGMEPKQLFGMFLTEALSSVIFGSIAGTGIGILGAYMFFEIITFETVIPTHELVFPAFELSIAFVILIITAILSAAGTAWLIFRKDTIKAIKRI